MVADLLNDHYAEVSLYILLCMQVVATIQVVFLREGEGEA